MKTQLNWSILMVIAEGSGSVMVIYLKRKHVPLFIAALTLLVFVSAPLLLLLSSAFNGSKDKYHVGSESCTRALFDAYIGPS